MPLRLSRLTKSYTRAGSPVAVVSDVSIALGEGELGVVTGPSGSGKTTLLLMAGGLLAPGKGIVELDGQDLYRLSPEGRTAFRAARIGFAFQQFHLVAYLSVRQNVLASTLAVRLADAPRRADELLERLGMAHVAGQLPGRISVGERQRTALARALLHRPKLLLADEPTGNIDAANAAIVTACFREYAAAGNIVLLATHDQALTEQAAKVFHLAGGTLR